MKWFHRRRIFSSFRQKTHPDKECVNSSRATLEEGMPAKQSDPSGPSLRTMLTLLFIAILVAALIAYRMIYPFFHLHPH
jgi:hypothetical protein